MSIQIWSDGSHIPGSNIASWGFVIKSGEETKEGCGSVVTSEASSLCAEIMGVINALKMIPTRSTVVLHTDNSAIEKYVQQFARGEKAKKKGYVRVTPLLALLNDLRLEIEVQHHISVLRVPGHKNAPVEILRADQLAKSCNQG